jgi:hypothetical protein
LSSTTAALRFSPDSLARFIGERLNFSLNSSCVIANEAGIDAGAIGAVRISDRYSLVEVPEEIADDVIAALSASTIKGKRVQVRRDRDER